MARSAIQTVAIAHLISAAETVCRKAKDADRPEGGVWISLRDFAELKMALSNLELTLPEETQDA